MTYTRDLINKYLADYKEFVEKENWLYADAHAGDFAEIIEQQIGRIEGMEKTFKRFENALQIIIQSISSVDSLVEIAHATQNNPEISAEVHHIIKDELYATLDNCDHSVGVCYCDVYEAMAHD